MYLDEIKLSILAPQYKKMQNLVEELKFKYINLWWQATEDFPEFGKDFDKIDKKNNENESDLMFNEFSNYIKNPKKENNSAKTADLFRNNLSRILGIERELLSVMFNDEISQITENFISEARRFNSHLDYTDIYQAMRNVWIMNSIQILLAKKEELTPSIFAYSMLYPYTDNYLDNPDFSINHKSEFSKRLAKRLAGELSLPVNTHETEIWKLISLIEKQYPRKNYPNVFNSLLSIHYAQSKSLLQQSGNFSPYENDILGISFEKGGTSVLADGYLVKGELSSNELDFLFGFGIFLQLIDDLSDIGENLKNNQMTVFTLTAQKWNLDKLTNKLFWFMKGILNTKIIDIETEAGKLKLIIEKSCSFMIINSILKYKNLYSSEYLKKIEKYCAFRSSYQNKYKKRLKDLFLKNTKNKFKISSLINEKVHSEKLLF